MRCRRWATPLIPEVDMMTASGHKFYGPKGIGALFVRAGVDVGPVLRGGKQERGRRAGTENVAGIAGFARALELAFDEGESRKRHAEAMRDRLRNGIQAVAGAGVRIVTPCGTDEAAPHILGMVVPPVHGRPIDGEMLLLNYGYGKHLRIRRLCMYERCPRTQPCIDGNGAGS